MWDDTIGGTTCGWTNLEAQIGLVLVPENMRDNEVRIRSKYKQITDRIQTEYGLNIDRNPSKRRQKLDETSTQKRGKLTEN